MRSSVAPMHHYGGNKQSKPLELWVAGQYNSLIAAWKSPAKQYTECHRADNRPGISIAIDTSGRYWQNRDSATGFPNPDKENSHVNSFKYLLSAFCMTSYYVLSTNPGYIRSFVLCVRLFISLNSYVSDRWLKISVYDDDTSSCPRRYVFSS